MRNRLEKTSQQPIKSNQLKPNAQQIANGWDSNPVSICTAPVFLVKTRMRYTTTKLKDVEQIVPTNLQNQTKVFYYVVYHRRYSYPVNSKGTMR